MADTTRERWIERWRVNLDVREAAGCVLEREQSKDVLGIMCYFNWLVWLDSYIINVKNWKIWYLNFGFFNNVFSN
jgi:hypothetical protein